MGCQSRSYSHDESPKFLPYSFWTSCCTFDDRLETLPDRARKLSEQLSDQLARA
jgi:hypothetical protein